jgi:hypothetical protein
MLNHGKERGFFKMNKEMEFIREQNERDNFDKWMRFSAYVIAMVALVWWLIWL